MRGVGIGKNREGEPCESKKQKLEYIFGFMYSDEKPEKPNESREGAGEVHKKRGKPLQKEPAPSNEGHTIKDQGRRLIGVTWLVVLGGSSTCF